MIQNWLKGNPLPWLLEPENPSVRYWTLVDILDRQPSDPDVLAARSLIPSQPLVIELFARQHEEGYWGPDRTKPYTAEGAVTVLSLLHLFAVPPDERTSVGCDSLLRYCQHESGGFSLVKTNRSGIFPCTTGEHLPTLIYFGMGPDPRVRSAFKFLLDSMEELDPLVCGRYQHRQCLWGAIAALNGLAVLPEDLRTERSSKIIAYLAGVLLDADYDFDGEHKRWLTFGVPSGWDLLRALKALANHGYGQDPRLSRLLAYLLEKQDQAGRWMCGSLSKTWPIEKRNQPSKWITLEALRVLKKL